jgi:hypothetical protein
MDTAEFQGLLGQLVETGCVDIRVLSRELVKKAGGEKGLANKIWDQYLASIGTGQQSINFTQVMKVVSLGIEADKQKSPMDELPAEQLHRIIKKIMGDITLGGNTTTGPGTLRERLDSTVEDLPPEGGDEPPGPEDGHPDSFDIASLADSLCREDGDGD